MIAFFTDAQLTRKVTVLTPKKFLISEDGGERITRVYLGDPDAVPPLKYVCSTNVAIYVSGGDARSQNAPVTVCLGIPNGNQPTAFQFPGTPVLFPSQVFDPSQPLAVDVKLSIAASSQQVFDNVELLSSVFVARPNGDTGPPQPNEQVIQVSGPIQVFQRSEGLPQHTRMLPANRQVQDALPGFIVGQYRWRDENTENAVPLVPTTWNVDPKEIGEQEFISGIAQGSDLEPVDVEEVENSIFLRANSGSYFIGPTRYYMPANSVFEILQSSDLAHTLKGTPRTLAPIFVGTWSIGSDGGYKPDTVYRYAGLTMLDGVTSQFTLERRTKTLTLDVAMTTRNLLLGVTSGQPVDHFRVPVFPVDSVPYVYIDQGPNLPPLYAPAFTFNRDEGTLDVPAIQGAIAGQPMYATCTPAVGVLYENGDDKADNFLVPADLNPAFAGIAGGFVYLQHRKQNATSVIIAVDKPQISIPSQAGLNLLAYGPVYFDGDYALLAATAYDELERPVSNISLQVVPGPNFDGLLNYKDPTQQTLIVRTGGDGTVNLIYTPRKGFGMYMPPTSLATTHQPNDTLVLAGDLDYSLLYNAADGWLVTTYAVTDDNPLFGKLNGDPNKGEIPFVTSGTFGDPSNPWKCNGLKRPWLDANGNPVLPIEARDAAGNLTTTNVRRLVYGQALWNPASLAAYFISYIERVTLNLAVVGSNVVSNTVLLQMAPPPLETVDQSPWLILDDLTNGKLNQFRLGWSQQFDPPTLTLVRG